jgi:hypothetical protein
MSLWSSNNTIDSEERGFMQLETVYDTLPFMLVFRDRNDPFVSLRSSLQPDDVKGAAIVLNAREQLAQFQLHHPKERIYMRTDLAKIANVSTGYIHRWHREGIIKPSITSKEGCGNVSEWSRLDAFVVWIIALLLRQGMKLESCKGIQEVVLSHVNAL